MKRKASERVANGDQSNGKGVNANERAATVDIIWRSRPLWRMMRPDHQYGPKLTLAARQLLKEERKQHDRD